MNWLSNPMPSKSNFVGPDHMSLSISPLVGNTLIGWSFIDKPPLERTWGHRKLYFMMIVYGVDNSPINFYLDIEVGKQYLICSDVMFSIN